jgi:type VI secretion system protein ImpH
MANSHSTRLDAVVAFITENHARLEFFQMARLLAHAMQENAENKDNENEELVGNWEDSFHKNLRVRPILSMAFPAREIDSALVKSDGKLQVETTFFGLYGVTSPLPNFYTEGLMAAEQNGYKNARGLIDIFHYAAFPLLIKAWSRHRVETGLRIGKGLRILDRKSSWIGSTGPAMRTRFNQWPKILKLAPLLSSSFRSASNLQALVATIVRSGAVRVQPCAATQVAVPKNFACRLGQRSHQLGEQAVLGSKLVDHLSHVEIVLKQQHLDDLEQIVPGGSRYELLKQSIRLFSKDNLRIRIKVDRDSSPKKLNMSILGLGASLGSQPRFGTYIYYVD